MTRMVCVGTRESHRSFPSPCHVATPRASSPSPEISVQSCIARRTPSVCPPTARCRSLVRPSSGLVCLIFANGDDNNRSYRYSTGTSSSLKPQTITTDNRFATHDNNMSSSLLLTKSCYNVLFQCSKSIASSSSLSRQQLRCLGHTVRIILKEDLPNTANGYAGDVVHVRAGYARNMLIPRKMALYATPENFVRLGIQDPAAETLEEKRLRLEKERQMEEQGGEELKAADILRHYLRNKVLKIWRNVDPATNTVHPGVVTAQNVRDKLSKQLKIDLDDNEQVHLVENPVVPSHDELTEEQMEALMQELSSTDECQVKIRQLGQFLAKISLAGGHTVPLKFVVLKR